MVSREVAKLLLCVLVASAVLLADPIDPDLIIETGGESTPVTNPNFSFNAGNNGGGVYSFQNQTGGVLNGLTLIFDLLPGPYLFNIVNGIFQAQSISFQQNSCADSGNLSSWCWTFKFYNIIPSGPVIPENGHFVVSLTNFGDLPVGTLTDILNGTYNGPDLPDGTGGWGPGRVFNATANVVPEPGYYGLLAAGLGLLAYRRWKSKRLN
jgi:hypothetical protein